MAIMIGFWLGLGLGRYIFLRTADIIIIKLKQYYNG